MRATAPQPRRRRVAYRNTYWNRVPLILIRAHAILHQANRERG
jgi:hypothetical protein